MLAIWLGSGIRHQRTVRQPAARSAHESGAKACEVRMGGALHREMADSADGKRRETHSAVARHPSGRRDQPYTFQSLPALRLRPLDDEGAPPPPVVSVC